MTAWRSVSPTWESPSDLGFDLDYTDEQQDDDDTSADDSVSITTKYVVLEKLELDNLMVVGVSSYCYRKALCTVSWSEGLGERIQ